MNQPSGKYRDLRYSERDGNQSADFPKKNVVDKPVNLNAH